MLLLLETFSVFVIFYYLSIREINFSFTKEKWINKDKIVFFLACFLVFIISLRKEINVSDYWNYRHLYETKITTIEPAFSIIAFICRDIFKQPVLLLMSVFAVLSIIFKTKAIKIYSSFIFISFLLYTSDFLLLHDYIQIRTGVASALMLFSIQFIKKRNFKLFFIVFCCAVSFHYSAVLMFPLYFLNSEKIKINNYIYLLIVFYIFAFLKFNPVILLKNFPIEYINVKVNGYLNRGENYSANIFSAFFLSKLIITILLSLRINLLSGKNSYFILMLKIQYISLFTLLFFSQNLAASMRISEFFGVIEIVLFPEVINLFEEKHLARFFLLFLASFWFCMRIFVYHNISW